MIAWLSHFWWETLPDAIFAARERVRGWWLRVFRRRAAGTQGQQDQARETEVSLGLMADAARAGADMTPEQQIFLSQSEHGMRERLSVLLGIPHRTLAQEREKLAIEGWLAPADQTAPNAPIRGFLAPVAAATWFRPWMILAAGWALTAAFCAVQMGLKERVEDQRDEARADLAQTERALVAARETQARLADAVREADTQTRQTAETIEQERARRLRAEREARRIRDAQAQAAAGGPVDYGFGGVRDAGGAAPGPGDDRPAGGDPG